MVGVEDEERERLAGAIQRRVVPHLSPIAAELSANLDVADPDLPAVLDRLIGNAEKALEELRIVVRGVFPRCCNVAAWSQRCPPNSMQPPRP